VSIKQRCYGAVQAVRGGGSEVGACGWGVEPRPKRKGNIGLGERSLHRVYGGRPWSGGDGGGSSGKRALLRQRQLRYEGKGTEHSGSKRNSDKGLGNRPGLGKSFSHVTGVSVRGIRTVFSRTR